MSNNTPIVNHLAIIPDGNRRWAKKQAISIEGKIYEKGSEKTFEIINAALKQDIPFVTFWASSYSNLLARPKGFVNATEDMYVKKFNELAKNKLIHEQQVKIVALGEWRNILQPKTIQAIQNAIDATSNYIKRQLTILVGYDGHRERGAAIKALLQDSPALPENPANGDDLLKKYCWTNSLPNADLIIRTGAWQDPHNSAAFLSMQSGESQLAFPPVLWPDFTPEMLKDILSDYNKRERRLGR